MSTSGDVLILGLGNRLMSDDAAGPLVIERLAEIGPVGARVLDGGTLGMALLPEIQASDGVIAVDAAWFGAPAGVVAVFEGREMEHMLGGVKKTAHEVALSDLIGAAMISGTCPARRALVAVQPQIVALGLEPTPPIAAAIPEMVAAVLSILDRWRREAQAK